MGRKCPAEDPPDTANPLWEPSSFSEAAMAAVLPIEKLPDPPISRASPHI